MPLVLEEHGAALQAVVLVGTACLGVGLGLGVRVGVKVGVRLRLRLRLGVRPIAP